MMDTEALVAIPENFWLTGKQSLPMREFPESWRKPLQMSMFEGKTLSSMLAAAASAQLNGVGILAFNLNIQEDFKIMMMNGAVK